MTSRYHEVYEAWRTDPEGFWREAAEAIDWVKPPSRIFDPDRGAYGRWFPDAVCNACHNAREGVPQRTHKNIVTPQQHTPPPNPARSCAISGISPGFTA